jgi:hypothetical protein
MPESAIVAIRATRRRELFRVSVPLTPWTG